MSKLISVTSRLSRFARRTTFPAASQQLTAAIRWKRKSAKMGNHLEKLEEMAHQKAHDEAKLKRDKNKQSAVPVDVEEDDEHDDLLDDEDHEEETDESILPDPSSTKERMKKVVEAFHEHVKSIRGTEPTPEMFDDVQVEAYGATTSLQSVAQVVIKSHTLANATCFDPALAKSVAKGIQVHMNLNPSVEEAGVVRIPLPRVSLETRQQTASQLNKRTEKYRQRLRNIRRKAMDVVKKGVAGKLEGISKDDAFRTQQEIEKITEDALQSLNKISTEKQESILQV